MAEVIELLEAGEAKAYYGLAINWKPLQALVEALLDRGVLQGREVRTMMDMAEGASRVEARGHGIGLLGFCQSTTSALSALMPIRDHSSGRTHLGEQRGHPFPRSVHGRLWVGG